ncbi:hypothetical protein QYF36_013529 [Acer negundo]|nr:hypothetical protein QYF36_013529 [Acer negundo]
MTARRRGGSAAEAGWDCWREVAQTDHPRERNYPWASDESGSSSFEESEEGLAVGIKDVKGETSGAGLDHLKGSNIVKDVQSIHEESWEEDLMGRKTGGTTGDSLEESFSSLGN